MSRPPDPISKLLWANEHLKTLETMMTQFSESDPYRISTEENAEIGEYIVSIEWIKEFPPFAGLVAGDFVCCLRSCLDQLAWQLALLTRPNPSTEICFPICEKDSLDTQLRIVRSTYGMPDAAISLVKSLQPYNAGDAYKSTHLWRLNRLWNIDKHRRIPIQGFFSEWVVKTEGAFPIRTEMLDNGNKMVFPLADKDKVEFNPDPKGAGVDIGDDSEGIRLTLTELREMYEFVAGEVIPRFVGFFTKPEIPGQQP